MTRAGWRSPAARIVCDYTGIEDPAEAVAMLVTEFRRDHGAKGPPYDVRELAHSAGVHRVEVAKLDIDGDLSERDGRLVIRVSDVDAGPRRRFTIAHEIGHVLLLRIAEKLGSRSIRPGKEVERLCNFAAAELLMPREQVESILFGRRPGVEAVFRVASAFDVSLRAAGIRVLQLASWCKGVGMVAPQNQDIEHQLSFEWAEGIVRESHGAVGVMEAVSATLRTGRAAVRWSSLPRFSAGKVFAFEAARLGKSEWVMVVSYE